MNQTIVEEHKNIKWLALQVQRKRTEPGDGELLLWGREL